MKKAGSNGSGGFRLTKYMELRTKSLKEKEMKDDAVFGLLGGIIMVALGSLRWLISVSWISCIWLFIALTGGLLFLTGLIAPCLLRKIYRVFSIVGNKIGEIIFWTLLIIVYCLFIIPVGILMKKKREEYFYAEWENEYTGKEKSGFIVWSGKEKSDRNGMLGTVWGLMEYVIGNGKSFLLPVIVVLIVLGIILFFVSSSVLAPFIYTLF